MGLLLWLQMRRGDRMSRDVDRLQGEVQRYQVEALNALHQANQWRALADQAINVTCDTAGRLSEGELDAGLLIHNAGQLSRSRQQIQGLNF
ncbi:hypothetical protein BJP27_24165 (plasmid) [Pseudomonas oryzihabitans]|nr:hypothetical protein BJP27_24165 [Pseudomonas psychrotolerans]